jgi:nitrite reductase/ring-hydroxylating ferredoxin subunit
MGGPVGEGMIIGKTEAVLDADRRVLEERFSETEIHLVCPWHGWEYDIRTGEFAGDRSLCLKRFETAVRGDQVYVVV